ncbi:MAG: lipoyl(octanoyl) transferase LipB [Paracoccaceae bacterium]|nr:lipoyl(octanoyl) transferase LipB [Paracoccaceae bacterium]
MVEWIKSEGLVEFDYSLSWMEKRASQIYTGEKPECVWLLEHPEIYTAGTSAKDSDLKDPNRFPVKKTNRGGQYTYHGPGQRVAYVLLNLNVRGKDIKKYVHNLELWAIKTLSKYDIVGETRNGRVGIWVQRPEQPLLSNGAIPEDKIAAIGVRLRKWVTFHGLSINFDPELSHFDGIVPCGISEHGVTSLIDLGVKTKIDELDNNLKESFEEIF